MRLIAQSHDPRELPSMLAGHAVPKFDLPPLVSGSSGFKHSQLSGGKIVLLNIFASWCAGRRYERPMLMRIATDNLVRLVGVNRRDEPVIAGTAAQS